MTQLVSKRLVSSPGASIFPYVPDTQTLSALYSIMQDFTVCGLHPTLQKEPRVSILA